MYDLKKQEKCAIHPVETKSLIMNNNQEDICLKYGVAYSPPLSHLNVGISSNVKEGIMPVNGLRHPPEGDTTGWYIWAGEYSESDDFFIPLCISHLAEWCPQVLKYLSLPPGWRFLIDDNGYEDVWYDESLLQL